MARVIDFHTREVISNDEHDCDKEYYDDYNFDMLLEDCIGESIDEDIESSLQDYVSYVSCMIEDGTIKEREELYKRMQIALQIITNELQLNYQFN